MKFNEYQQAAKRTMNPKLSMNGMLMNAALGLSGESGEVADHIKKHEFQGHSLEPVKIVKELGDILWYITLACEALQIDMAAVAEVNIKKLQARYPEGFSEEASRNRPAE